MNVQQENNYETWSTKHISKKKIDKFNYIKINNGCLSKDTSKIVNRYATNERRYFPHISPRKDCFTE